MNQPQFYQAPLNVPPEFLAAVKALMPEVDGRYAAQILWQRGIKLSQLPGYLNPHDYQPASPWEFGQEMKWAVKRLTQAIRNSEKVTIWGDFDADGVTSTSVLWSGLGQFFQPNKLNYRIPNRFTDSHGLNHTGIAAEAEAGTSLIVTCDTGSTNVAEIAAAQDLGLDIIITDHHTLPPSRPEVVAIINPRYFAPTHPLYHLSGVAVAYKLVEALYETLPDIPAQPVEALLDLVAIGLVADLVHLQGDCRYLAQQGIRRLQTQASSQTATRPGIHYLLKQCRRGGDRPMDIGFGIGPRINAVSRIEGDASFCVQLLTSSDAKLCKTLAEKTELANTRRKSLQKDTLKSVKDSLANLDLSTTGVIVLEDSQWQGGVLGLVAGQIASEYGKPTILLSRDQSDRFARGSARSVNNIDLYELVDSQRHLLDRFGGHPFAAGLSLPLENLSLFRQGINQEFRRRYGSVDTTPAVEIDLVITVAELGKTLFKELNRLEPYGMGNPVPKLLVQKCWFNSVRNFNIKDAKGKKVSYIKTVFKICDESDRQGFPGVWWGHYRDEIPSTLSDAVVELDYNSYDGQYEVRLMALRSHAQFSSSVRSQPDILDWRNGQAKLLTPQPHLVEQCPANWHHLRNSYDRAWRQQQNLALAYDSPPSLTPTQVWQQLVGIVKYLVRTGKGVSNNALSQKLGIGETTLSLGLEALEALGFKHQLQQGLNIFIYTPQNESSASSKIRTFLAAVEEEQFQRQYFAQVPLKTLQAVLPQNTSLTVE